MSRRGLLGGLAVAMVLGTLALGGTLRLVHKYFLSPCAGAGPERNADFELLLPPLELAGFYGRLLASAGPAFEQRTLASIPHRDRSYPIYWLRRPGHPNAPRVLIAGGVHGDERAALLVLPDLLDALGDEPPGSGLDVVLVAPINPVGVAETSRYNAQGCDINRDFGAFATAEARALRDALSEYRPDLVVAPHEGPQEGTFVIVTSKGSEQAGAAVVDALERAGLALAQRSFLGYRLGRPGLSVESPWVARIKSGVGLGSLGTFLDDRGIPTYTVETSWSSPDFEARIRSHRVALLTLLEELGTRSASAAAVEPTR